MTDAPFEYRVIEFDDEEGPFFEVMEVEYEDGRPVRFNATSFGSQEGVEGLRQLLARVGEALDKPVLKEAEFDASR